MPNGLRVVVLAERRGVQLVSAAAGRAVGQRARSAQLSGLATITAGLLAQGTRRHSASAVARAAETLGGSLESGAGWNQSAVSITVAVPQLDAALGLVSEAVRHPTFAQTELDRLRTRRSTS